MNMGILNASRMARKFVCPDGKGEIARVVSTQIFVTAKVIIATIPVAIVTTNAIAIRIEQGLVKKYIVQRWR